MKKNLLFLSRISASLLCMLLFCLQSKASVNETIPYTSNIPEDVKLTVASGSATSAESGYGIALSYDGNKNTYYHSSWSSTVFPVTLVYNLSVASNLDYIQYSTRQDGSANGNFKLVEIQAKTSGATAYHTVLTTDLKGVAGTHRITFDSTLVDVASVKVIVKSGAGDGNGFAACAEMQFYRKNLAAFDPATVFTDASCMALKPGIARAELEAISSPYYRQLALDLFDNTYVTEFRIQDYKAWPHPDTFSRNNRVGTYSLCDNPTGIFVRSGDTVMVFVDDTHGYGISLCLKNYNATDANGYWQNTYYSLYKGANRVVADRDGLFYVFYHTSDHLTAPRVKIHFGYGKVNGYYDSQKHSSADWTRILNLSTYEYFDALGQYAHLSYPKAKFKANAATTGPQLVQNYDDLVYAERNLMGYYKYPNRNPYNRSHFVVMYHSYMYSTSYHTGYNIGTMDGLTSAANVRKYPWGPAHEVGHSNQHSPLLKWVGTTEVTNNIQSAYVQTLWGNTCRLTEENRYQEAFDDIVVPKKAHCQVDIWRKLVPFWQLQLFFSNVLDRKDFYASVYEGCRTRPTGTGAGQYQLNFVKIVVDSSQVDLTEFFNVWGFLKPVNQSVEDYWTEQLTITQAQSTALVNYIKGKNFPVLPYKIQYINDTNWPVYKNKLAVEKGIAVRFGASYKMTNWNNVVAYEAWQGDSLVKVTQTNQISVPGVIGAQTKVYAVQYDGTKIEVVPDLAVEVETPVLSDATTEKWYYVKNMGNDSPRNNASLTVSSAGTLVQGSSLPVLRTQRWKLVDVNGKTGLVNEKGLYLGADMKATTTPYGWTLENVSQGGSSGYRFAAYGTNNALTAVAHLSTSLTLMNYSSADAASVWQFVPADAIKPSTDTENHWYEIGSLRYEEAVLGSALTCDNVANTVSTTKVSADQKKWKIVNYNSSTGACNIVNEEGKFLSLSGSTPVLSTTSKAFYLMMTSVDGVAGYRIATSTSTPMLNLSATGALSITATYSIGALWSISSSTLTDVASPFVDITFKVHVDQRKVTVRGVESFDVFNANGQRVVNDNLKPGVYIVKAKGLVAKVVVR